MRTLSFLQTFLIGLCLEYRIISNNFWVVLNKCWISDRIDQDHETFRWSSRCDPGTVVPTAVSSNLGGVDNFFPSKLDLQLLSREHGNCVLDVQLQPLSFCSGPCICHHMTLRCLVFFFFSDRQPCRSDLQSG